MRPESFTITTFWLDWLLMPLLAIGAWFTARWALHDSKQASDLEKGRASPIPSWGFSIPLFAAALAWVIAGFGTLIREDYWEMRVIFAAFLLWTLSSVAGAFLLFLMYLRKRSDFVAAGVLNLIGLTLMSLLMILPGLVDYSSPAEVTLIGHVWFVLLVVSVGLLTWGVLLGFPYKFPRFPLGLGVLFLIGWGLSEVAFSQASFPWLVRIWRLNLGLEYLEAFPHSGGWLIAGALKALIGISTAGVILIVSHRRRTQDAG
jgi:hypothetical protein